MFVPSFDRITPEIGLGFDDILIQPAQSGLSNATIDLRSRFSRNLSINTPFAVSGNITETRLAIAMAQAGGIGIIHAGMAVSKQAEKVGKVKRFQARITRRNPTVTPDMPISEVMDYKLRYDARYVPVVENGTHRFLHLLVLDERTDFNDPTRLVSEFLSDTPITTRPETDSATELDALMARENLPYIVLLDEIDRCAGVVSRADPQQLKRFPRASVDKNGALLVAAAVGTGEEHFDRVNTLIDSGVDAIVVDAAFGHSKAVVDMVTFIRRQRSANIDVIAGNVTTTDGALALLDAGADGIKVGSGLHGAVGVPAFTALLNVAQACIVHDAPVIADCHPRHSNDMIKALAAGASSVILDTLVHDCSEAAPRDADASHKKSLAELLVPLQNDVHLAMNQTGCASMDDFRKMTRFTRLR